MKRIKLFLIACIFIVAASKLFVCLMRKTNVMDYNHDQTVQNLQKDSTGK